MKIVVTGGRGMIGCCIKDIINIYPTCKFTFLTRKIVDLTKEKDVLEYFQNNRFDYIIHLAADVGGLFKNLEKNVEMFENNMKINMNVLKACHLNKINRGIFVLSSCIYTPEPSKFPMDENMIHEGPPHPSNEGYAYAKRMMEMQCRHYNKTYNTEYICLIPVNLYGPYDNFNLNNGHFIPSVLHRFYKSKLLNDDFLAYGTGKPYRQFLYGPDFAFIICEILLKLKNVNTRKYNKNIIVCNDEEYTIKEVIFQLCDSMNIDKTKIIWDTNLSDGCMKKTVDNSRLKTIIPNIIPGFKFTSLKKGLIKTYLWFHETFHNNIENIRR